MSATTTVEVRGHKVRTRSSRRYLVVAVRPKTIVLREGDESCVLFGRKPGTYVAFAEVVKRTDSLGVALQTQRRLSGSHGPGAGTVVVDTATGKEV